MAQPMNIPGRGGTSRDQEITNLLGRLQQMYDHHVGHPRDEAAHRERVGSVLDRLAQAANPGATHSSTEVTEAIQAARNLLGDT